MSDHFFIAGAQRSGTTMLRAILDAHPEIDMAAPARPEPKFFLRDDLFARGLNYYRRTFFLGDSGVRLRGEKSVSYMESQVAAERISRCLPDARIVFVLRDPVERAVSHYLFSVRHGVETLPIEEAFEHEAERTLPPELQRLSMSPWAYLSRGHYARDIERWECLFRRESLFLILYEDLISKPGTLAGLLRWLGVREADCPPVSARGASRASDHLPTTLRRRLRAHFADSTRDLALRWHLDVTAWSSPVE